MSSYYLTIIGTRDNPLYEVEFSSFKPNSSSTSSSASASSIPGRAQFAPDVREILPFIANSSLDIIDDSQWSTSNFNLGRVDSFYGLVVNAFITQGNVKFVLCYDNVGSGTNSKYDDNLIRQFFIDVNDLYVKCLLNPFYRVNDAIVSPEFDIKVKLLARKYF
ncbi:uncharacterized protein RJT21DRAFT_34604 [Scheffersomyces amazonensis]|uniref:uncharacterized protein n=1 Tax=Scheffersomyces amazonensis TaxID=1078765 RepID=UPI00315D6B3A